MSYTVPAPTESSTFQRLIDTSAKHRSQWHHRQASNLIFAARVGSYLHGADLGVDSDIDIHGVCIESPEAVVGFDSRGPRTFEQYIYSDAPVGEKTQPGGRDVTIVGLRKFLHLCAKGDPNMLTLLFIPLDRCEHVTPFWEEIVAHRDRLITNLAGERYVNYLRKQLSTNVLHDRSTRTELITEHGWDTKAGYHGLRIAIQGCELINQGRITLPMYENYQELLYGVRAGEYTKQQVLDMVDSFVAAIELGTEVNSLPDAPDYEQLSTWASRLYRDYWDEHPT